MKKTNPVLLIALVLFFLPAVQASAWQGIAVKVLDGDSLKIKRAGMVYEIRLYGIDTPEYKQPFSNKAKQFTKRLTLGKAVFVQKKDIDKYGRIGTQKIDYFLKHTSELVREGLAWFYPKYCLEQPLCGELQSIEAQARKQRRGLWRDKNPVSPWEWKRRERESGSDSRFDRSSRLLGRRQ